MTKCSGTITGRITSKSPRVEEVDKNKVIFGDNYDNIERRILQYMGRDLIDEDLPLYDSLSAMGRATKDNLQHMNEEIEVTWQHLDEKKRGVPQFPSSPLKTKADMLNRIKWLERELTKRAELHTSEVASLKLSHAQAIKDQNYSHACQVRDHFYAQNTRLLNILENGVKAETFPRKGS